MEEKKGTEENNETDHIKTFIKFAQSKQGQKLLAPIISKISGYISQTLGSNNQPNRRFNQNMSKQPQKKKAKPKKAKPKTSNNSSEDLEPENIVSMIEGFLKQLPPQMTVGQLVSMMEENRSQVKEAIGTALDGDMNEIKQVAT